MDACFLNSVRAVALFLGFGTLLFACVGFGTNNWLEFDVDRSILLRQPFYLSMINPDLGRVMFTRHRGIFRECYSDGVVPFLNVADDVVDSDCFELDFDDPDHIDVSDDYCTRIELLRCVIAFFTIGIAFGIATIVVAIVSICRRTMKWVVLSFLCALFTGLFVTTAIAFFLGVDHMEREDRGDPRELVFRKNWSSELEEATSTSFGWSFALSWVAVALALICAVLYLVIALDMRGRDDESSDTSSESDTFDKPSANTKPYQYHYPYVINEAYQGNLGPAHPSNDNLPRPPRRALRMAVPSNYPGEAMYPGAFFYDSSGAMLPAFSYVPLPDQAPSRSRKEKTESEGN